MRQEKYNTIYDHYITRNDVPNETILAYFEIYLKGDSLANLQENIPPEKYSIS